jgi:hypothetical protein
MDKGMKLMDECFDSMNVRDYQMTVVSINDGHRATVCKAMVNSTRFTVVIPSAGHLGSRFGSCTCGQPATDGVPCKHMVVVAKSSSITGLSRIQIMPYCWTTAHWQAQYPEEVDCRADLSMTTVKGKHHPDELLCYCPSWAAGKKKGRPKNNERKKSISNHIKELEKKKRKRRVRMFCKLCHRFNHNTEDCFKNPINKGNLEVDLEGGESNEYQDGQKGLA